MSHAGFWRLAGWRLAEHYAEGTHELRGDESDDAMRIRAILDNHPETQPTARTAMRDGWRRHRAGEDEPL